MTSDRLPPGAGLFLLFHLATAFPHIARQTPSYTLRHRTLDGIPFPTPIAGIPLEIRQDNFNTICGFIDGNPDAKATCGAGSHCVLDSAHGIVGCCPNGGPCTTGIFTGCVDFNSGPQAVVDPYIFTCDGGNVCYQNNFDGGYSQYGCGTASSIGTSVATRVSDLTLPLTPFSFSLTEPLSSLATPTSLMNPSLSKVDSTNISESRTGSTSENSSQSSSSISNPTSNSSSSSSTSNINPSSMPTTTASLAPEEEEDNRDSTGAIVGGTLSGIAILIFLVAMGVYFWRRRQGNTRKGPGVKTNTQYISPVSGFRPIPNTYNLNQVELSPFPQTVPHASGAILASQGQSQYSDTTPLQAPPQDIQGHTFNEALSRIEEEDDPYNTRQSGAASTGARQSGIESAAPSNVGGYGDHGVSTDDSTSSGNRPLWQQSRNQMWL